MLFLQLNSYIKQPFTIYNRYGNKTNITNSSIVFTLEDSQKNIIFQKKDVIAGGSTSEIAKITAYSIAVFILASDTVNLLEGYYKYNISIDSKVYELGILKFVGGKDMIFYNRSGTTAERPGLPSGAMTGFNYFDTTLGREIYWDGTAWLDSSGDLDSSVTALETRMTATENNTTTNASNITTNASNITTNTSRIDNLDNKAIVTE